MMGWKESLLDKLKTCERIQIKLDSGDAFSVHLNEHEAKTLSYSDDHIVIPSGNDEFTIVLSHVSYFSFTKNSSKKL